MLKRVCKTLLTVGLTSLFSLLLYDSLSQVKAQPFKVKKNQFSNQQEVRVKCGYRTKEIELKLPQALLPPTSIIGRVDQPPRCGQYPPILLTALIPESSMGMTVAEYPTFLFYIPNAHIEEGELVLLNEEGQEIYKQTVLLKDTDNIISIDLSASPNLPPLEVDKFYSWSFTLVFDRQDTESNAHVEGWIKRVEPNLDIKHQLEIASPQKQAAIYAANGVWYEALTSLAKLRCSSPDNSALASDWHSLLQQVGLKEISNKPLAQCNQAKAQ